MTGPVETEGKTDKPMTSAPPQAGAASDQSLPKLVRTWTELLRGKLLRGKAQNPATYNWVEEEIAKAIAEPPLRETLQLRREALAPL